MGNLFHLLNLTESEFESKSRRRSKNSFIILCLAQTKSAIYSIYGYAEKYRPDAFNFRVIFALFYELSLFLN